MKYNLYYNSQKINNVPIDDDTLQSLKKYKYVYKKTSTGNIKIPVKDIKVIRCILI